MNDRNKRVQEVSLEFRDERTPVSPLFDDVYFAPASGLQESTYVYLEGSGFLDSLLGGKKKITMAEVGFGVGLNFILTYDRFKKSSGSGQVLHYFSFEKYPVKKSDLTRLYSHYPELEESAGELLSLYPIATPGVHLISLLSGRVQLYLCLGDAHELLPRVFFRADHWYWDGFAPRLNPDAFSDELFREVKTHSSAGSRGASFTAAGWVRRLLSENDFIVTKRKGFGKKRECISASFTGDPVRPPVEPWFSDERLKRLIPERQRVAVLGAGLAGSAIARVLAEKGAEVVVFDPRGIATRASGNPIGLFNTQLSRLPNPMSRFFQGALARFLREIIEHPIPNQRGIFRTDSADPTSLETSNYPTDFYQVRESGIFFRDCGMINPKTLCERRMQHSKISLSRQEIIRCERSQNHFDLHSKDGPIFNGFDHVIYAMGADPKLNDQTEFAHPLHDLNPTRPIRGQIILVKPSEKSKTLDSILVDEGYATPIAPEISGNAFHLIGATYQAKTIDPDQEAIDRKKLVLDSKKWGPFSDLNENDVIDSRIGFRLSTPDKLPMIGPLCDPEFLEKTYSRTLRGARNEVLPPLEASPGEWLLTGLGSRGVTTSRHSAEILASMMLGDPLPIESDLLEHLHSARFFIRNLRRPGIK